MNQWMTAGMLCLLMTNMTYAESEATETRQKTYASIEEKSENLEDLVDDEKWQEAAPLAEELANKVATLSTLFPVSSKDEGRARDAVWEEWSEFSDRLLNLESDFRAVSMAIAAGDYQLAEDKLDDATSACNSCHMSYRSLW